MALLARVLRVAVAVPVILAVLAAGGASVRAQQAPVPPPPQQQAPPPRGYPPPPAPAPPPRPQRHVVPYEPGMAIPPGGHIERHRDTEAIVGGVATFFAFYAGTLVVASLLMAKDDPDDVVTGRRLTIPVAGPFAVIPRVDGVKPTLWLVLDGLAQMVGLVGFAIGLAGTDRTVVYYTTGPAGRSLALSPTAGPGGAGLRLAF